MEKMMVNITTLNSRGKINALGFIGFFKRHNDEWIYEIQDGAGTMRGDISGEWDSYLDLLRRALLDSERHFA